MGTDCHQTTCNNYRLAIIFQEEVFFNIFCVIFYDKTLAKWVNTISFIFG